MKNLLVLFLFITCLFFAQLTYAQEVSVYQQDQQDQEKEFTRFPQGQLRPIIGAGVIGGKGNTSGSITLGLGYNVVDRLEIFFTLTQYFDTNEAIAINPGIKWVIYEWEAFAPYLKVKGGPVFYYNGGETEYSVFAGAGFYIFFSDSLGLNLGFLPGCYFAKDENYFAWIIDAGLVVSF